MDCHCAASPGPQHGVAHCLSGPAVDESPRLSSNGRILCDAVYLYLEVSVRHVMFNTCMFITC